MTTTTDTESQIRIRAARIRLGERALQTLARYEAEGRTPHPSIRDRVVQRLCDAEREHAELLEQLRRERMTQAEREAEDAAFAEAEAEIDDAMAEAEARARWHAACDADLEDRMRYPQEYA